MTTAAPRARDRWEDRMISDLTACLRRLLSDERGATAVEYSLIAAGVAVAIASTVWLVGAQVKTALYDKIAAIF
jgi:pilus assembly protein Flp/PilA